MIVTNVGQGMRWTRQRRARGHGCRAGEIWSPVSGQGAQTNDTVSVRKNRVGLMPQWSASSLAEARHPNRALAGHNSRGDGVRKAGCPGVSTR